MLHDSGLEPARLELEITESVFIDDPATVLTRLHALRALGVRSALDDFGTGYSSLSYLRHFPFDTLKIDRSFVHELAGRESTQEVVALITQLANMLGMRTIAEGVESSTELEAVSRLGCEEAQGVLMAAPTPLAELVALRARWPEDKRAAMLH